MGEARRDGIKWRREKKMQGKWEGQMSMCTMEA